MTVSQNSDLKFSSTVVSVYRGSYSIEEIWTYLLFSCLVLSCLATILKYSQDFLQFSRNFFKLSSTTSKSTWKWRKNEITKHKRTSIFNETVDYSTDSLNCSSEICRKTSTRLKNALWYQGLFVILERIFGKRETEQVQLDRTGQDKENNFFSLKKIGPKITDEKRNEIKKIPFSAVIWGTRLVGILLAFFIAP